MKRLLIYIFITIAALPAAAQQNSIFLNYIENYKTMAIEQMQRHRVPASITLAQGILESAAGQSYLATAANNHFGIKVGTAWTGPWVKKDDDAAQEMFRKYDSPAESYEDHSLFLKKARYAKLFDLDITDYKGWAHGLKAAGYATNPQYPQLLIKLIEDYNLTQYDRASIKADKKQDDGFSEFTKTDAPAKHNILHRHTPRINNDLAYVLALSGDSYETIAMEYNLDPDKLRSYNEVGDYHVLHEGDIVYLAPKKAHVGQSIRGKYHRVSAGESIHYISQLYGVKFKKIYEWNNLPASASPQVGDLLLMK